MDGPHTVTCGSDGSWDESPPTCQPVLCSEPPNLQNGFVEDVSKVVRVGENVSLACIEGYRLVGPHYLLCSAESRWEGDMPHCISVDCGRPPKIPNSNFSMDDTVLGSVVTYQCHDGFEPNDAIGTQMTCNTTGHWQGSSKELRCLPVSCPPLQSIRYGDLKMTGIRLGNNVTYSCMEGYELTGDRVRICQANGSWSGHAPHCSQVRCNTPEDVNGGWFEGSAPWVAGTTLIYSCHPGYRRMGPSQLTCLDSGRWSAQKPECLLVECPVPNPIPGGFYELNLNNDLVYRSVVTYDCDEGFTLIGNATRECAENGSWSGVMPMCKKVSCDSVGNIEHGRVELDSFFYFSKVNYTCDEGFIIQGPQTRVCLANGTWSGVEPKCIGALCPVPEPLRHGEIRVSDLGRGGAVEYSCQEGFVLDGQIQRRCQTDSTGLQLYWSGDQPKCIAINCTTPDDVPNGSVQAPTLRYGSFAEYTCATGYDLIGPAIRRCLSDGSWSNNTPVCLLQECPRPTAEDIVKGRTLGGNYGVGAIVQFECEVGYKISGHSNLTCTTNKTWSGPIPSCIPISCSKTLFAPFNGHITMDSNLFGSRVRYSCLEDFELRGDVERVCLADGTWSGEEPSCLPIHLEDITALRACDSNDQLSNGSLAIVGQNCLNASCPDPEPILHGVQRVYGNGTYGTTVYVECQAEYSLVGSEIRQCLKNGTWNGVAPSCISIECPIPQTPQNGNLELDGTMVGSTVQYGCHRGYKIIGDSLSTCMRDGTWSRAVPECQPIECPKLIAPDNGHVTVEGYNFGNVARYNCDPGYDLNDDELRVCLENQTWSGKNPQCEAIVCPVPELVNGGQVSAPSLTLGSIARYSCFQGRSLQGLDTRICMTNRIWNGSVPLCELIICPPLNSIPNGRLLGLFEDDHQYNETVSFECNPTFGLQGKHELRCLEDGAWDGSPPVCVRTHCERPPLVLEASVTGNSTTIGSIIEYECRVGFRLVGESSRRCLSNGHWSGKIPTCVPVSCGQPPEVANASTQLIIPAGQESNSYGSTVVYICNDGYDLTGSPALICEADGSWFGQIPSCQHLTCGPPHVIPHATVRVESYEQLSRAVYLCDDGFTMITGGLTVVHCLPGGVWDVNEKL